MAPHRQPWTSSEKGAMILSFLQDAVAFTNHYLWDYLLLFLLCGTGVYFTLRLRFIQVLRFGESFRRTFGGIRLRGAKADGQG